MWAAETWTRLATGAAVMVAALASAQQISLQEGARMIFLPLPARYESSDNPLTPAKLELGQRLYFDRRLSKNHDLSCASCHDLARFGVDNLPTSPGHKGQLGRRNSQTVFNAGNHIALFWDGRATSLEEQVKGPLLNPAEMAMPSEADVEKVVRSIPGYVPLFARAFPDEKEPITFGNISRAIAAFERTLVTPSRFDAYLRGDTKALSAKEEAGLRTFMGLGCMVCHRGEGIGGSMFQQIGFSERVPAEFMVDLGRFEMTRREDDRSRFRVPSLRNIEKTAPYLHTGSMKTLGEVIRFMGKYQLGKDLEDDEVAEITDFLKTLTGTPPKVTPLEAFPSGPETPKPDPG